MSSFRARMAGASGGSAVVQQSPEAGSMERVSSLDVNPGSPQSLPPASKTTAVEEKHRLGADEEKPRVSLISHETNLKEETEEEDRDGEDDSEDDSEEDDIDEKAPEPRRTRFIKDPDGPLTHDKTTVDVVTVPCPGGHPLRSWNRDGLLGRYFGAPSMRDAEVVDSRRPETSPSWVRQGIRREASAARILLYEHPEVQEGTTLGDLASALLEELKIVRSEDDENEGQRQRPVVFVGHSIGGLVVKMALTKAGRDGRYEDILRDCYGVAFFGTPHQGSSYFAMPSLAPSIQNLLQLTKPLPTSITDDLRVGNGLLMHADEDFKAIANDLRVWTLYETIDSRLSGGNGGNKAAGAGGGGRGNSNSDGGIYFTAPLASIKSAILGMRQERIFPLQSDHANVASFGRHNVHTLRLLLRQLSSLIGRADASVRDDNEGSRWTLHLEQTVSVEIHGFFEDVAIAPPPPKGLASAAGDQHIPVEEKIVRAWSTRLPLKDLLAKGPEECLNDRLHEVEGEPEEGRFLRKRGKTTVITEKEQDEELSKQAEETPKQAEEVPIKDMIDAVVNQQQGLGIKNQLIRPTSPPNSPVIRPVDSPLAPKPIRAVGIRSGSAPAVTAASSPGPQTHKQTQRPRRVSSPPPVVGGGFVAGSRTGPTRMPSPTITTRHSTPMRRPSPLIRADFEQDLAVDRLSPPSRPRSIMSIGRSVSDSSRAEYRDFPPFSQQRSRSTVGAGGEHIGNGEDDENDDVSSLEASPRLPESIVAIRKVVKDAKRRTSETVIVDEVPVAFARPEISARKFVWIHLAYNNPSWVKSIIETMQTTYQKDYTSLFSHEFWATKHTRGRHSQHYAYYAKPGCYFTPPRTLSPRSHSISPSMSPNGLGLTDPMFLCLFLPYLHFDSYKRLIRRRDLILSRLSRGRARPVPQEVAKAESVELQVIWEYLGHDPPINCRRTLDQYGYPSLRDTRSRDDDQMLYKLTKERGCYGSTHSGSLYGHSETSKAGSHGSGGSWRGKKMGGLENLEEEYENRDEDEILNGNVLMVDQMWLWVIHPHTLLSFFPKRESDPIEGPLYQQADLRDSIFNEVNVDLTRQCESALDLAALAALHAVSVLLERASHPDLEVFRIFDEAISVLNEKLTSSLKTFRVEGFKDKSREYEPVENKERSIRARHREEGSRAERENRDNTSALLELRDIEDELLVLLNLFDRQHAVLTSMYAAYGGPSLRDRTVHGRAFLAEAVKRVTEYRRRADDMTQRVRATRDDYDKLLQMVQRQAQVDEVRLSRLHADLASAQSRSVMIFTIFTVIFLPLTFFTGLFGMNTREWDGKPPSIKFIGAISLPGSVALIVLALVAAWSNHARTMFSWAIDGCSWLRHLVYVWTLRPVLRKMFGRRRRLRNGGDGNGSGGGGNGDDARRNSRQPRRETSDFWARHRLERDGEYQIPEVNRKKATRKRTSGAKGKKDSRGR